MSGYTKGFTKTTGQTIEAADAGDEFTNLDSAFDNATGHKHDGTAQEGPVIGLIGDAGETSPNNKVLIDTGNNHIEFYIEDTALPVQQFHVENGAIIPTTDSDIDLGDGTHYFKNAYIDTLLASTGITIGGATVPTISSSSTLTNKTIVVDDNTIITAASGNLTSTELDAALAELQTDIDTRLYNTTATSGTDFDDFVDSGAVRLNDSHSNAPTGIDYGQMLVVHGAGDTITQIAADYQSRYLHWRSGNPPDVGGSGTWGDWEEIWHTGNDSNLAKYDASTANFTGTLQNGGSNVITADGTQDFTGGILQVGVNKTTQGSIDLYGPSTGVDEGGEIRIYPGDDWDNTVGYWAIDSYRDTFRVFSQGSGNTSIQLDDSNNIANIRAGTVVLGHLSADTDVNITIRDGTYDRFSIFHDVSLDSTYFMAKNSSGTNKAILKFSESDTDTLTGSQGSVRVTTGEFIVEDTQHIIGTSPKLYISDSNATADEGNWFLTSDSDQFTLQSQNDARSSGSYAIRISRSGAFPDLIEFNTFGAGAKLDGNWICNSDGGTGGSGSAGSGNQYVEIEINGTTYKVLHDGTV